MENEAFVFDSRLDTEYLDTIYEGDKEYASVVFEQFITTYPLQWAAINESFTNLNIAQLKSSVHKIKATFSFVGLTKLTNLADALEKNCVENYDFNTLSAAFDTFKTNFITLIPIIEEELKRLQE